MYIVNVLIVTGGVLDCTKTYAVVGETSEEACEAAEELAMKLAKEEFGLSDEELAEEEELIKGGEYTTGNGNRDLVILHPEIVPANTGDFISVKDRNEIINKEIAAMNNLMKDMPEVQENYRKGLKDLARISSRKVFISRYKNITGAEDCDLPDKLK